MSKKVKKVSNVLANLFVENEYFARDADPPNAYFFVAMGAGKGKVDLMVRWYRGDDLEPDIVSLPLAELVPLDIMKVYHVDVEKDNKRMPILTWREQTAGYVKSLMVVMNVLI